MQPVCETASPLGSHACSAALQRGEVESVRLQHGYPFRIDAPVVYGAQRGRTLGFPTANLFLDNHETVPADGVYAGRALLLEYPGQQVPSDGGGVALGLAAISVGTNPTFNDAARSIEAHILDFSDNLYGALIGVEFWFRVREQIRYGSVSELIEQIDRDITTTRSLLGTP